MKALSTTLRSRGTNARALFLSTLFSLSGISCSRPLMAPMEGVCPPLDLLEAVQRDPEIKLYASGFFEEPRLLIYWRNMPTELEECSNSGDHLRFVRPSDPGISKGSEFILIEQMYFDADAAFVNAYLYPSSKNIDAFLRKRNGRWQVTQKSLWEN